MPEEEKIMSSNKNKIGAAAVLAATILIVGSVVGYGLHRAGTVGKPFSDDGRIKVMASIPCTTSRRKLAEIRLR